jgi:hypothetical protein
VRLQVFPVDVDSALCRRSDLRLRMQIARNPFLKNRSPFFQGYVARALLRLIIFAFKYVARVRLTVFVSRRFQQPTQFFVS